MSDLSKELKQDAARPGNCQINNDDHPKRHIQELLDLIFSKKMHGLP